MNDPRDYNFDFPTPLECQRRWRNVPAVAGNGGHSTTKHGKDSNNKTSYCPWTDEEQAQLIQMVDEALHSDSNFDYTKVVTIGNDKVRTISWTNIAKAMNRTPEDISHAWSKIRLSKFKRGAYSPEEDRLIVTRVREWYSQPEEIRPKSGLWVALEKELNREDKRISERWRSILSKRVTFTVQESVSSHSLLSEPISKAKRQRKDNHAHNVFDNQNQHHFHHITNISSSGAGSFPPHASISVETFGMVPGDSVKGKDHIDMNMIALVDDSNFEFEVMEKPESVRWNDDMVNLIYISLEIIELTSNYFRTDYCVKELRFMVPIGAKLLNTSTIILKYRRGESMMQNAEEDIIATLEKRSNFDDQLTR